MSELTFVIPAYNAQDTITATLLSAQKCNPAAIVVVDDGSKDQTAHVATALGALVIQQENAGPAAARRRGLQEVRTEFVVLLDADDQVLPDGVARSQELLSKSEAAAVVGQTLTKGRRGQQYVMPVWDEGITAESLVRRCHAPAPPASILFRTSKLREALTDEDPGVWPKLAEDYELLLRVALTGDVLFNEIPVATYTWVGGRSSAGIAQEIKDARSIQHHYATRAGVPESELARGGTRQDAASIAFRRAGEAAPQIWHPVRLAWTIAGVALAPERVVKALRRRAQ